MERRQSRILVIGDSCIDKFIYCNVDRLCPEAPVPVLNPVKNTQNMGMAGNVIENLKSLGVDADFITNECEIIKTRYVDIKSGQMIMRFDEHDQCEKFKEISLINFKKYDAIIISDYNKGFLNEEDMEYISKSNPNTFLDSKRKFDTFNEGKWCYNFNFIKINSVEYNQNKKLIDSDPRLYNKCIITRGNNGCEYNNKIYPTVDVPIKNVSGAGDTFLASFVFKYLQCKNIEESIKFAQECTLQVVQKPGVSLIIDKK